MATDFLRVLATPGEGRESLWGWRARVEKARPMPTPLPHPLFLHCHPIESVHRVHPCLTRLTAAGTKLSGIQPGSHRRVPLAEAP